MELLKFSSLSLNYLYLYNYIEYLRQVFKDGRKAFVQLLIELLFYGLLLFEEVLTNLHELLHQFLHFHYNELQYK